jgi:hypothetical protein
LIIDLIRIHAMHRYRLNPQVCMYESMCAGVRRLLDEGINLVGKVASFSPARIDPILQTNLQTLAARRSER